MNKRRSVRLAGLVFILAVLCGGWFLQSDARSVSNVYMHARVLDEVMRHIRDDFVEEVDVDDLYRAAIHGLVDQLADPNSRFVPATVWEEQRIRTLGDYRGVGLEVVHRDGFITVSAPIPATPAARAGLRPGDRIVEVDGQSVEGWLPDQAVGLLRGEPGTSVRIGVSRPGVERMITFEVTRAVIQVPSVPFAVLLEGGIGYVPLLRFNLTTTQEVHAAMDSLQAEGMTSLVLDLRGNRGGLLSEGVALSDLFLDPGDPIVEIRSRSGDPESIVAGEEQAFSELPVVVLVNGASASAAEIVAGALQDHDRALLIGAATYGKGSVQSLFPLAGGNGLSLTTARWYTPAGRSIERNRDGDDRRSARGPITVQGDPASRPDLGDKPRFKSAGGRLLHGGGGIVPDLWMLPDTLTAVERSALDEILSSAGGFFAVMQSWAVDYLSERPDLEPGFVIADADLRDFHATLLEHGAEIPLETFMLARHTLALRMGGEIALLAWDDMGRFRRTRGADAQLGRAVELLRAAGTRAELFALSGSPLGAIAPADSGRAEVEGSR